MAFQLLTMGVRCPKGLSVTREEQVGLTGSRQYWHLWMAAVTPRMGGTRSLWLCTVLPPFLPGCFCN